MSEAAPTGDHGMDPRCPGPTAATRPDRGIDLAVAVDLVMLRRGLTADEAYELMRVGAEASGGDLGSVATDVIDLGTARLPR
jgi:hypothetical protein